jgi:hypothetical protein
MNNYRRLIIIAQLKNRHKSFLWDFNTSHHLHTPFAALLFLKQLPLPTDITAIAFRKHIFPQRFDVGAGDHPSCELA